MDPERYFAIEVAAIEAVDGGRGSYDHPMTEGEHGDLCPESEINIYDGEQAECYVCRRWYELPIEEEEDE